MTLTQALAEWRQKALAALECEKRFKTPCAHASFEDACSPERVLAILAVVEAAIPYKHGESSTLDDALAALARALGAEA